MPNFLGYVWNCCFSKVGFMSLAYSYDYGVETVRSEAIDIMLILRIIRSISVFLTATRLLICNGSSFARPDCIWRRVYCRLPRHPVLDFCCHCHKCLFYICCCFSWCLQIWNSNFIGKCFGSCIFNGPLSFKIWFISNKEFVYGFWSIAVDLIQPLFHIIERFRIGYIEDYNNTMGTSVVAAGDCSESFLTCCVPLQASYRISRSYSIF